MSKKLARVSAVARNYNFTEAQIRWWIFQAAENGLAAKGAIIRIGRAVFIDQDLFDAWLESQTTGQAGAA